MRTGRERPEKILVAMHRLSRGATTFLKYEDIVVEAFKAFPDEFALRGYPAFPVSSDIHKPLYGVLKRQGLVKAVQKQFALTPRGVEVAQGLIANAGTSLEAARSAQRMTRALEAEMERMCRSEAFRLFSSGQPDRIPDTGFYAFLGCTVRTGRNDFLGRLAAARVAVETCHKLSKPNEQTARLLVKLFTHLNKHFEKENDWKKHGQEHARAAGDSRNSA